MRTFALYICIAASSLVWAADNARITRVEQGLRPGVTVQGKPAVRWSIAERMQYHRVPGLSVAVVNGGKIEWARGYGVVAEGGRAVDAETLFQAASISKPVAAMAALRLVDQGRLALDEDVNLKLRSWKVPDNDFTRNQKVTLRRLLNHSAGLTVHGFPGYAADAPVPSLLELLDGGKPANTAPIRADIVPGTRYRYSGGGYEVMQQLVMDVTGKPWPQYARESVLVPLKMNRSTFEQPLPAALAANAAAAHSGQGVMVKGRWHTYPEMTAAGLWTTPSDLARFVLEMQKPGRVQSWMLTALLGDYGLGLSLAVTEGRKSFSHGGANNGYRCLMFGYVEGGQGAVVMTSGDRGAALASEVLRGIAEEYGWTDYRAKERASVPVPPATLREYAGRYVLAPGFEVVVETDGERLFAAAQGVRVELIAETPALFYSLDSGIPDLRFTRGADGGMEMAAGGRTAKKSP